MNTHAPPIRMRVGEFCCKCDWLEPLLMLANGPGPHRCGGCRHVKCGHCGITTSCDRNDTIQSSGYPAISGKMPTVLRFYDAKTAQRKFVRDCEIIEAMIDEKLE